jgi:hypothetical protein
MTQPPTPEPASPSRLDPATERRVKIWTAGIIATVVAVVALLVWRSSSREPTAEELRDDAKRACQEDFIPKRLKAPADAEFSGVTAVLDAAGSYRVEGTVDSPNSFGAQARATFSCAMHRSGDNWVLESAEVRG